MFGKTKKGTRRINLPFESTDGKPYIFASYGHDDKEKVFPLLKELYEPGYNVWYDEGITIGEKYDEVIESHIRQSSVFVLFASSLSLSRPYVLDVELKIAGEIRNKTPLLTLFIENDVVIPEKAAQTLLHTEHYSLEEIKGRLNEFGIQCFGRRKAVPIEREVPQYWFDSYDLDPTGQSGNTVWSAEEPFACLAFHGSDLASCNPYAKELFFAGYNVRSCENMSAAEREKLITAKGCKAFVPFVTKNYVESGTLERDYLAAKKAGKPLVALYIRESPEDEGDSDYTLPSGIAEDFSRIQGLDMRELTNNDFISKLEAELERRKCFSQSEKGRVTRRSFEIKDFLYDFDDGGKRLILTRYRGEKETSSLEVKRAYFGFPVKKIGNAAFRYASGLACVTVQDGVESVGDSAFKGCASLVSVTLPDSVAVMEDDVFSGCSSLTSIRLPETITTIPKRAFEDCDELKSVLIPQGVTSIGNSAFSGCVELESVNLPDGLRTIGDTVFYQCECLTSAVIPDSVRNFGDGVFMWCVSLKSASLSRNMERVGAETFSGCSALAHIEIPEGIMSIDGYAFYLADGLTSVTIPESVTEIGDHAFEGCDSLECVTVLSPDTVIGEAALDDVGLVRCREGSEVWEYCEEAGVDCEPL